MSLEIGEYYLHVKSGRVYRLMWITNGEAKDNESFKETAVYSDDSGNKWSRPLVEFLQKFEAV